MKKNACLLVVALACGCATAGNDQPTYSFVETNEAGQRVRAITVALTDEKGEACIAGNWKRARVVSDPGKYTKDPVYSLENGKLQVLLVNGICDAYDSYVGETKDDSFAGDHVQYGWTSTTIGKVTGSLSAQ